ncbi:SAM-dependent methyltransferase [Limibacillus sp. MBR-115]|jgi:NADH dehydrogenase [ubiquinone] 1 alpha subcomplex assembly factor 7|uniref:class I SAM-dependent methyltransferase n=1 Tax=Limibacillus sp. MBR-115 TaxID=3156465 RepID=UPI00339AE42B
MSGKRNHNLTHRLKRRIALEGPISLADYMAAVLTDPSGGYYMTDDPFGVSGDFITAPEVSQMFGEMVGLWCADLWQRVLDGPKRFILAEVGPGRGTLMSDLLRAASVLPGFAEAAEVHLVEVSPALRKAQKKTLKNWNVTWHGELSSLPEDAPLVIIGNEFLDALPVRHYEKCEDGWRERLIGLDDSGERFVFLLGPLSPSAPAFIPPALHDAPLGVLAEVSPIAVSLVRSLAQRLVLQGGAALFIDYGRQHPSYGATLQAVRGHRPHDPLVEPGSADLTAHVDFASLIDAAETAGAAAFGPVTQGAFLQAMGLEIRAEALRRHADERQRLDIDSALTRLMSPEEMGELFKVLAITQAGHAAPAPFAS